MLDRTPGFVSCSHCGNQQGSHACPGCGRLVCADCALDRARCPEPRPERCRLAWLTRALHVDAAGRHLLVVDGWRKYKVYDLNRRELAAAPQYRPWARDRPRRGRVPRSCVLPSGRVAHVAVDNIGWVSDIAAYRSGGKFRFLGTRLRTPGRESQLIVGTPEPDFGLPAGLMDSDDGTLVHSVCSTVPGARRHNRRQETVDVIDPAAGRLVRTIDAQRRITSSASCGPTRLLALALLDETSGGERLHLFDIDTGRSAGQAGPLSGHVLWIGLCPTLLAIIVRSGDSRGKRHLELYDVVHGAATRLSRVEASPGSDPIDIDVEGVDGPTEASLARDGTHLAVRLGPQQVLWADLRGGAHQVVRVDLQTITLVRVVDGDRRLIVGGNDVLVFHIRKGAVVV